MRSFEGLVMVFIHFAVNIFTSKYCNEYKEYPYWKSDKD
jgi:hypothetical protein